MKKPRGMTDEEYYGKGEWESDDSFRRRVRESKSRDRWHTFKEWAIGVSFLIVYGVLILFGAAMIYSYWDWPTVIADLDRPAPVWFVFLLYILGMLGVYWHLRDKRGPK
jgi:polyferredoxin